MRRAVCLLLAASMLLVPVSPTHAVTLSLGGEVEVEYNPASLTLGPGDLGAVYIMVRNLGEERLYFQMEAVGADAPGGSAADVINHMMVLDQGGVDQVVVTIESKARLGQDPDLSDVVMTFRWGHNATLVTGGAFRFEDPKHEESITYDVVDDYTGQRNWILGFTIAAGGVIGLVYLARTAVRWRRGRGKRTKAPVAEPYGEGLHDRKEMLLVRHVPSSTIQHGEGEAAYDPLRSAPPYGSERRERPPP